MGGVLLVALAAGAGAVAQQGKNQERLLDAERLSACEGAGADACPAVEIGELVEHGVRYSTIVIKNEEQERTTLLRVRDAL